MKFEKRRIPKVGEYSWKTTAGDQLVLNLENIKPAIRKQIRRDFEYRSMFPYVESQYPKDDEATIVHLELRLSWTDEYMVFVDFDTMVESTLNSVDESAYRKYRDLKRRARLERKRLKRQRRQERRSTHRRTNNPTYQTARQRRMALRDDLGTLTPAVPLHMLNRN